MRCSSGKDDDFAYWIIQTSLHIHMVWSGYWLLSRFSGWLLSRFSYGLLSRFSDWLLSRFSDALQSSSDWLLNRCSAWLLGRCSDWLLSRCSDWLQSWCSDWSESLHHFICYVICFSLSHLKSIVVYSAMPKVCHFFKLP